jgi:AraC family transcriptional activator of tynA and feaB
MNRAMSTEPRSDGEHRTFLANITAGSTGLDGFDALQREWGAQVGETFPLPPFESYAPGAFRLRAHSSKVHDAVITDFYAESMAGDSQGSCFHHVEDRIVLHVMQNSAIHFARPRDRGGPTVSAGQFIAWRTSSPWHASFGPRTATKMLILPEAYLRALVGDRSVVEPADSAEMRVLMAYANMVGSIVKDLTATGVQAARDALIELVKGVLSQGVDGNERRLAPALAQAAKDIVDRHLADPDLSPALLARELNVSVRTLHRVFATTEESVTAYIRRRRLQQARADLASPHGHASISEVAAHWQFADSSHFIRAFKKHYGETPAQFARSSNRTAPGTGDSPPQTTPH